MTFERIFIFSQIENPILEGYPRQSLSTEEKMAGKKLRSDLTTTVVPLVDIDTPSEASTDDGSNGKVGKQFKQKKKCTCVYFVVLCNM
jgi:hypothetical protein